MTFHRNKGFISKDADNIDTMTPWYQKRHDGTHPEEPALRLAATASGHQGQGRAAFRLVLPAGEKQSEWHILEAGSGCGSLWCQPVPWVPEGCQCSKMGREKMFPSFFILDMRAIIGLYERYNYCF